MRRFLIVFCILVLLVALAVPCFAVGQSGSSDVIYYNSLQFDELVVDGCDINEEFPCTFTVPFPFGTGLSGSTPSFSFASGNISGWQGLALDNDDRIPEIVGALQLPCIGSSLLAGNNINTAPSFTLSAHDAVIELGDIVGRWRIVYPLSSLRVVSVQAMGLFVGIGEEPLLQSYSHKTKLVTFSEAYFPNENIDVSYVIRKLCENSGFPGDTFYLSSLHLTFNFRFVSNDEEPTFTFYNRAVDSPRVIGAWFNEYELPYKSEVALSPETDVVSWMVASVESFMELELFPGFAINDLFALIVVILLLFWFITLLI